MQLFCQPGTDYKIVIKINNSNSGTLAFINIEIGEGITKMLYQLRDAFRYEQFQADSAKHHFGDILSAIPLDSITPYSENLFIKLDSITNSYSDFSEDSIRFSNKKISAYINLFKEILRTPSDSFEVKPPVGTTRIVLHGTSVSFRIREKDKFRAIFAYHPSSTSHPLLYRFLKETIDMYRENKKNDFLNRLRKAGY